MSPHTFVATVVSSALCGALLVLACSDDSPGDADAAACDCPAAEPPVPARIRWVTQDANVAPMSTGVAAASCPAGAKLLGGGCSGSASDGFQILRTEPREAGNIQGMSCTWRSTQAVAEMATATAICLVP